ncbi:ABC transporter permease [Bengtsoniella intestinalis]|uniref:ABC transporter permease n=1 Tax=Bengtsoniella intestinalis TaxID=3073143 RepID=UPI00391F442A
MKKKINLAQIFWGSVGILFILVVWFIASQQETLGKLMPNPLDVFSYIFVSFVEPIGKYTIGVNILYSMSRVMVGYLLACVVGITLGFLVGWFKVGEAIIKPFYLLLKSIPSISWIPLAIMWFGIGEESKYFIIFIAAMLIIMTNAIDGVADVNQDYIGVARMLGTSEKQIFFKVVFPSAVPQIFNGLQVGLSAAWASVVAAEMVASSEGAGWLILMGQNSVNMVQIFAGIIIIGVMGLVLALVMRWAEAKLCAWNIRGA